MSPRSDPQRGPSSALRHALLGLQPHLRSASAQAEQVPPALAGGCDPESLALHAGYMRSMGRLRGHIPGGAPVPRSGVPSSHPHLAQRASRNLIRASLALPRADTASQIIRRDAEGDDPVAPVLERIVAEYSDPEAVHVRGERS